jgi:hypothetical protein
VSILINRKEEIKKKGFSIALASDTRATQSPFENVDFSKIKVGAKTLDDAIYTLGDLKRIDKTLADKKEILRAMYTCDYAKLRDVSNFFYKTSGIYSRLCRYMAYLYRYDWMVTPYINAEDAKTEDKVLDKFYDVLLYLDNFEVKKFFGEVALKVIRYGCYYGYLIPGVKRMNVQELPANYCRSRFMVNNRPAVEFNMKFFDDYFRDTTQKIKMLNSFPKEFKKGYIMYKEGKLPPQFAGDTSGWYLLDPEFAFKFNINGEDFPAFISVIPAIIDLDEAKELDRKKMAQELLKIIIQKMPLDKNGDLVFDVDEAAQLHNNAVNMLSKAIGVDVLTTFAEVDVEDMDSDRSSASRDDLERVERTVYNEAGVSQMQFNTDGNIALEKSILNDEASLYNLITQFEQFLNVIIDKFNKQPKKFYYRCQILTTTIYNYKEMAKLYKEQMQVGFSKMLPQIALGQSQSSILANAYWENDVLDLINVFIPPLMSSTMNAEALAMTGNKEAKKSIGGEGENPEGGRPTKESQGETVSDKTIQNKESQN